MLTKKFDSAILDAALKKDWWGVYINLRDRPGSIYYSELIRTPDLEEGLMRSISSGNLDLLRLMITRDHEVTSRYPQLGSIKEAKTLGEDHLEAWALSAALRSQKSISILIRDEIEIDPHQDFSGLLERAYSYPKTHPEFLWVLSECITYVLTYSSLIGLQETFTSLRKEDPELFGDSVAALTSVPEYLSRASQLWRKGITGHEVLKHALQVAKERGFPEASIDWLEDRLREPAPTRESEDEEDEFPF